MTLLISILKKSLQKNKLSILKTFVLFTVCLMLLSGAIQADAQGTKAIDRLTKTGNQFSNITGPSLPEQVGMVIKVVLSVLGIVFMIYLIYAGWLWLTAAGNDEKVNKAKTIIRGAIIGIIIVLAAYIITATVVDRLVEATRYKST